MIAQHHTRLANPRGAWSGMTIAILVRGALQNPSLIWSTSWSWRWLTFARKGTVVVTELRGSNSFRRGVMLRSKPPFSFSFFTFPSCDHSPLVALYLIHFLLSMNHS